MKGKLKKVFSKRNITVAIVLVILAVLGGVSVKKYYSSNMSSTGELSTRENYDEYAAIAGTAHIGGGIYYQRIKNTTTGNTLYAFCLHEGSYFGKNSYINDCTVVKSNTTYSNYNGRNFNFNAGYSWLWNNMFKWDGNSEFSTEGEFFVENLEKQLNINLDGLTPFNIYKVEQYVLWHLLQQKSFNLSGQEKDLYDGLLEKYSEYKNSNYNYIAGQEATISKSNTKVSGTTIGPFNLNNPGNVAIKISYSGGTELYYYNNGTKTIIDNNSYTTYSGDVYVTANSGKNGTVTINISGYSTRAIIYSMNNNSSGYQPLLTIERSDFSNSVSENYTCEPKKYTVNFTKTDGTNNLAGATISYSANSAYGSKYNPTIESPFTTTTSAKKLATFQINNSLTVTTDNGAYDEIANLKETKAPSDEYDCDQYTYTIKIYHNEDNLTIKRITILASTSRGIYSGSITSVGGSANAGYITVKWTKDLEINITMENHKKIKSTQFEYSVRATKVDEDFNEIDGAVFSLESDYYITNGLKFYDSSSTTLEGALTKDWANVVYSKYYKDSSNYDDRTNEGEETVHKVGENNEITELESSLHNIDFSYIFWYTYTQVRSYYFKNKTNSVWNGSTQDNTPITKLYANKIVDTVTNKKVYDEINISEETAPEGFEKTDDTYTVRVWKNYVNYAHEYITDGTYYVGSICKIDVYKNGTYITSTGEMYDENSKYNNTKNLNTELQETVDVGNDAKMIITYEKYAKDGTTGNDDNVNCYIRIKNIEIQIVNQPVTGSYTFNLGKKSSTVKNLNEYLRILGTEGLITYGDFSITSYIDGSDTASTTLPTTLSTSTGKWKNFNVSVESTTPDIFVIKETAYNYKSTNYEADHAVNEDTLYLTVYKKYNDDNTAIVVDYVTARLSENGTETTISSGNGNCLDGSYSVATGDNNVYALCIEEMKIGFKLNKKDIYGTDISSGEATFSVKAYSSMSWRRIHSYSWRKNRANTIK